MSLFPKKTRSFCFTNFNVEADYDEIYARGQLSYLGYGLEEAPTTGRLHAQGWLHFINPRSTGVGALKKIGIELGGAHVEPMRGSIRQNEAYCSKAAELAEWGTVPQQGTAADLKETIARMGQGETSVDAIVMDDPHYFHMYGRTLDRAEDIANRTLYRDTMTEGIWLWGPTGVGKTHRAMEGFDPSTHYVKCLQDQWWDGYAGHKVVLLNDFRGQITFSEMLQMVDKWPHSVRRRNRQPFPFVAEKVIVTSSLHPKDVYKNVLESGDSLGQLTRRFQIIFMGAVGECLERNTQGG